MYYCIISSWCLCTQTLSEYSVLYCIVLYCIVLYCIVLYCIVLYCIVLYCTVLYCIVLRTMQLCKSVHSKLPENKIFWLTTTNDKTNSITK